MYFIQDLLDFGTFSNKNIFLYLEDEKKKIPMALDFYVADDIFFFEVEENAEINTLEDLRNVLEEEAKDECWAEDIYVAPMEKILNCEIRFAKDFSEVTEKDIFYNCYEIYRIGIKEDEIIIKLK